MLLHKAKLIFWDFDGVIKDSVEVKTQAFVALFNPFGDAVAKRVRQHHETNGGMSRFDKMPLYLQWAGEEADQSQVDEYCDRFARLVFQGVVDAPWVPGVESYLRANPRQQSFALISATPQEELEKILNALNLATCFVGVFGAPTEKKCAIAEILAVCGLNPNDCIMVGDALADSEAARVNQVPFLLRRHETNSKVFASYTGPSVKDFTAS
jgi:phosphoglycolate phosphatase-like HAD superfamily hydrolase